jgi:hypothetical protein
MIRQIGLGGSWAKGRMKSLTIIDLVDEIGKYGYHILGASIFTEIHFLIFQCREKALHQGVVI